MLQGLDDENEYLLAFDNGDFDKVGTTFMVDDWLLHTPMNIVLQNFGVNETVFENLPETDPYILNATVSNEEVTAPDNEVLTGNNSYVYVAKDNPTESVPGGGGTFRVVDTSTFPIAETIAAAFVTLEPGGLRELHWHPNVSFSSAGTPIAAYRLIRAGSRMALLPRRYRSGICVHGWWARQDLRFLSWRHCRLP